MHGFDFQTEPMAPMNLVPVAGGGTGRTPYPAQFRDQVVIDVIHDGGVVPPEFLVDKNGLEIRRPFVQKHYLRERDWGACLVAGRIAERLCLAGYWRVNTARVLMDFGRFPGSTGKGASHLRRFAINYPFSDLLSFEQKMAVLENHYDAISDTMDLAVRNCVLKLAVHTYDQRNASGTIRPHVSLITRALGYQEASEMPQGFFDPMFPDVLGEFTADRVLRDRISLTLEKAGIPVAHNYPYLLPEGSPEVRAQVWSFFSWLRGRFQDLHTDTGENPDFGLVWDMLLDTNLRSSSSDTLRGYLHMYRRPPKGRVREFKRAEKAYGLIRRFLRERPELVEEWRFSDQRPSTLGIEVRKDLIYELDAAGIPEALRPDAAIRIADTIADAIIVYFNEDRLPSAPAIHIDDPWYPAGPPAPGGPVQVR